MALLRSSGRWSWCKRTFQSDSLVNFFTAVMYSSLVISFSAQTTGQNGISNPSCGVGVGLYIISGYSANRRDGALLVSHWRFFISSNVMGTALSCRVAPSALSLGTVISNLFHFIC